MCELVEPGLERLEDGRFIPYNVFPAVEEAQLDEVVIEQSGAVAKAHRAGVSGHGNCRMRDLIPDSVGALLGFAIVSAGTKIWQYRQRQD